MSTSPTERMRLAGPVVSSVARLAAWSAARALVPGAAPGGIDTFDPPWWTAALAHDFPDAVVSEATVLGTTEGTTTRARVGLRYAGPATGPATVFVKLSPRFSHRWYLEAMGLVEGEVRFYRDVRPALEVAAPRAHHVEWDQPSGRFVIVLDDMAERGCEFGDARRPIDATRAAAVLDALAELHAATWEDPRLTTTWSWLQQPAHGSFADVHRVLGMRLEKGLTRAGGLVPAAVAEPDRIHAGWWALQLRNESGPAALLHGDPHLGNLAFEPAGRAWLLDWQVLRRGSWAHDVGYFLQSALEIEERRAHERDLLDHYLDRVGDRGAPAPARDEAWERYRLQPAYGLPMWLGTLALGDYQDEEICRRDVERYAAAASDLGTYALLLG